MTTDFGGGNDNGYSVALQSDGKIVVAGSSGNGSAFAVVRYNVSGTLDTNFGGTGKVTTPIGTNSEGHSAALQSDGKIVVAGYSNNGSNNDFAVVRYNTDGTLDTTFNSTGKVTTDFSAGSDVGNGVALQSDGKIVVAGSSGVNFALIRYNANGSLDTSLNGSGKVTASFASASAGNSVALQSDGKIFVAGGNGSDFAVARFQGVSVGPAIAVEQIAGTNLSDGAATVDFGVILTGGTATRTFTIKNSGGTDLTGLGITFTGVDAADFTVTPPSRSRARSKWQHHIYHPIRPELLRCEDRRAAHRQQCHRQHQSF